MRATTGFAPVCCIALFGIAASSLSAAGDADPQVLAKDLNAARTSGKVAAVIWTVRAEHCTLQVVFPNAGRIAQAKQDDPNFKQQRPRIQVWLLKADGTLIAPTQSAVLVRKGAERFNKECVVHANGGRNGLLIR